MGTQPPDEFHAALGAAQQRFHQDRQGEALFAERSFHGGQALLPPPILGRVAQVGLRQHRRFEQEQKIVKQAHQLGLNALGRSAGGPGFLLGQLVLKQRDRLLDKSP